MRVQKIKYKINWLIVLRNASILFLLFACILSNKQLKDNDIKMQQLDNELNMALIQIKHALKSKLYHKTYTYIPIEEKSVKTENNENTDRIYLGKFKITHYCACKKCCGPNAQGITASGKRVEEGVTIAVDPKVIKLGSKVYIEEYGERVAQDTGSAIKGNRIDVYVADHQKALDLGVVYKNVYLVK